jgi:hypothetical protein
MLRTVEGIVEEDGKVRLLETLTVPRATRALVTILEEAEEPVALLSEAALARDWDRPEEDEAWAHLQPER